MTKINSHTKPQTGIVAILFPCFRKISRFVRGCGLRNPEGLNFISRLRLGDDKSTQEGEWPHVCTLFKKNTKGNDEFLGGASLIAPRVLVTAAHKIK